MEKDTFHNIINQMHCLKYIVKQLEDLDLISPCFFERTWRSCGDLYDPAVFFCLPDQVPKFRFFVIEGKEPGERDVPTPCLWQHHVVMLFYIYIIYIYISVFIIYRRTNIKQVLLHAHGGGKTMVQYWVNNPAHHARWKAI